MPRFPEQAETANNRDAMVGIVGPRMDRGAPPQGAKNANGEIIGGDNPQAESDAQWLAITRQIKAVGEQYIAPLRTQWANNYRAMSNQHLLGSKYTTERYRGRSQLHRPKTFTSVKKANAGAANALFATSDIVEVTASNPLDPRDVAAADLNKELLNLRLKSKSSRVGLPWFMVAIGAHDDTRVAGICISKQYWDRREKDTGQFDEVPVMGEDGSPMFQPLMTETGQPEIDPTTGMPAMAQVMQKKPRRKVICDKPAVRLFPPELVIRDPAADWLNQAQDSSFIGLMHAMTVGDIKALAADPQEKTGIYRFREVPDAELLAARIGGGTPQQVNSARETGGTQDRRQLSSGVTEFDPIWVIEWFVRYGGQEWNYWTAGSSVMLTDRRKVEEVYPEQNGARPIVIGIGNIQPHKIDPISMVQSTLPLQQEMDDLVNMRLDGVKESIRPLTFVKRGKNIDVRAIQNRSGDSAVYVQDKDDVSFDRPGALGGEAYMEMNYLNVDFDDATGQFNGGTVSTNRQLNETVGGMQMMNASANIVGDFDLRTFIETWVEPCLAQLVNLEQYYEDDKTILRIAGEKAKLREKYNINQIDEDLIARELSVSVNAGIGNADPMVKLDKFIKVAGAAINLLGAEFVADRAKQDAIINELFGAAGFRDAAERFFHEGDQTDQRIVKLQQFIGELQQQLAEKGADRENQVQLKRMDAATQMVMKFLDGIQKERQAERADVSNARQMGIQHANESKKASAEAAAKGGKKAPVQKAAEPDPQDAAVEDKLAQFSQVFMSMMLPALMGQRQPAAAMPAMPAPPQQEVMPPQPQGQPGMDPAMMAQMIQSMVMTQQQVAQGMQAMAEAVTKLASAQIMPKTVQKNGDGTMTLIPSPIPMPAATPQPQPVTTGEQVYG